MTALFGLLALLVLVTPARAELGLPAGFTSEVYVSGQGFDTSGDRGVSGIPAVGSLGIDAAGTLYLSRTGARFRTGDVDDLSAIYRIPVGGARLTPDTEGRYLYGPPLPNPQIGAVAPRGAVWVTTYDRERKLGALYRFLDRKPVLFAGGRPAPGAAPLLRHPEGVAIDAAGDVYVADREAGAVVRLDAQGDLVNARYATALRPRILTMDEAGNLWVGGDGTAETPFGAGSGEISLVASDGRAQSILQGPLPAGFATSPAERCSWSSGGPGSSSRSPPTAGASTSPAPATAASCAASRSPRSRRKRGEQASLATFSWSSCRAPCGSSTRWCACPGRSTSGSGRSRAARRASRGTPGRGSPG